jgi:hypothetical protein
MASLEDPLLAIFAQGPVPILLGFVVFLFAICHRSCFVVGASVPFIAVDFH